jgi:hypothetical protein
MYPFHAAPCDYFRFSKPALKNMMSQFHSSEIEQLGTVWVTISQHLQLKAWPWSIYPSGSIKRLMPMLPILVLGLAIYGISIVAGKEEDEFALLYGIVATK